MDKAKKLILDKIRGAYAANPIRPVVLDSDYKSPFFSDDSAQDLRLLFAEQFTQVGGDFIYCRDIPYFIEQLHAICNHIGENIPIFCEHQELQTVISSDMGYLVNAPEEATVAISGCDYLIARTGSIVINGQNDRIDHIASPAHIVIANDKQLVFDMQEMIRHRKNNMPSVLSVVTGPSRTADIEKTLVMGVHGSKNLYVCLVQSP